MRISVLIVFWFIAIFMSTAYAMHTPNPPNFDKETYAELIQEEIRKNKKEANTFIQNNTTLRRLNLKPQDISHIRYLLISVQKLHQTQRFIEQLNPQETSTELPDALQKRKELLKKKLCTQATIAEYEENSPHEQKQLIQIRKNASTITEEIVSSYLREHATTY